VSTATPEVHTAASEVAATTAKMPPAATSEATTGIGTRDGHHQQRRNGRRE
jgi:hypothetical protein